MKTSKFFRKKILLASLSAAFLPVVFAVSCGTQDDLLNDLAILAKDKNQLNNSFPLNFDVFFNKDEGFYKRLLNFKPYEEASEGIHNLWKEENRVIIPYSTDELVKMKNAFVEYIKGLKSKFLSLAEQIKKLDATTDQQKIIQLNQEQAEINQDLEKFRKAIGEQIQSSIKVLIIPEQDALKNISASSFIKIHNDYKDQSVDFEKYLSEKIPNIDPSKPLFKVYILRRAKVNGTDYLFNLNYFLDIFPYFSITRALKSKEKLNKDIEISRIVNKGASKKTNIDANNNLLTHPFENEKVDDKKGAFTYGDGLYISDFGDITFLAAAGFYVAGFKTA